MSPGLQRLAGATGTIAVAAAVNLATWIFTDHHTAAWWISGTVLLILGGIIQWRLPIGTSSTDAPARRQSVRGTTVGGSARQTMPGPGVQEVDDSRIRGDLDQQQGPTP